MKLPYASFAIALTASDILLGGGTGGGSSSLLVEAQVNNIKKYSCPEGFVDCVNGRTRDGSMTCKEACEGHCCTDKYGSSLSESCKGFTGMVCKDGSCSCGGCGEAKTACVDANIGIVINGCLGDRACQDAGFIGQVINGCQTRDSCVDTGGFIGSIIDSCNGPNSFSCYNAASPNGTIVSIVDSCNSEKGCINYNLSIDPLPLFGITACLKDDSVTNVKLGCDLPEIIPPNIPSIPGLRALYFSGGRPVDGCSGVIEYETCVPSSMPTSSPSSMPTSSPSSMPTSSPSSEPSSQPSSQPSACSDLKTRLAEEIKILGCADSNVPSEKPSFGPSSPPSISPKPSTQPITSDQVITKELDDVIEALEALGGRRNLKAKGNKSIFVHTTKDIGNAIKNVQKAIDDVEKGDKIKAANDLLKAIIDLNCEDYPGRASDCNTIAQVLMKTLSYPTD